MQVSQNQVRKIANEIGIGKDKLNILLGSCKNIGELIQMDLGASDKRLEAAFKAELVKQLYKGKGK